MLMTALALTLVAVFAGSVAFYWLHVPAGAPLDVVYEAVTRTLALGGRERTYIAHAPQYLQPHSPLVIVLHGSGQDAQAMQKATGYAFERLAGQRRFAVAYPNACGKHWNDGHKAARHPAHMQGVDDAAFIAAVIDSMAAMHAIDPKRVFVFGYSGGGHMAFRLAQEAPARIAAIAVVAANIPAPEGSVAAPQGQAVPAMLVNGTDDPVNPYDGGPITRFGFGNRGEVLSARASANHFARLHGAHLARTQELAPGDFPDPTRVVKQTWTAGRDAKVVLYSVQGGGHVIPHPHARAARLLGRKTTALDAPKAACEFFGL
ncbi:polyhydroxybutyrate depolymerase [Polaromonas sp. YR568]|uniref:alpha/beta hydrolase family esterase n=1 Tax=Polaromonas sp. YR568 TaxID=1855301 RepID=UPI0008ED9C5B|nr:alpha/beta fold hydrolase [Polaromonas sp. YR568]SFU39356.1 polyhydroxybutyrate depolymerase [Polaromonas sp. YR568]